MGEKQYVLCSKESLEIKETTPFINLLFDVTRESIKTTTFIMCNTEMILNTVLKTLRDQEQQILTRFYGLDGEAPETEEQIAASHEISVEEMNQVKAEALRKLRHPSRARILVGRQVCRSFSAGYGPMYSEKIQSILRSEVKSHVEGNYSNTVYLKNILEHYNMKIISKTNMINPEDVDIEDMGLSVRSLNYLKRAGMKTLADVLVNHQPEGLFGMRYPSRKSQEEILERVKEFTRDNDGYNTLEITIDGVRTIYKYSDDDNEKITSSIIQILTDRPNAGSEILHSSFSPGLREILMLKGYLFENDVFDDGDLIERQLREFGFVQYAEEIAVLKRASAINLDTYDSIYICKVNEHMIDFIESKHCSSLKLFRKEVENQEDEDLKAFVKDIKFEDEE